MPLNHNMYFVFLKDNNIVTFIFHLINVLYQKKIILFFLLLEMNEIETRVNQIYKIIMK